MNQILYTGGKKGKSPKTGSKSSIQKIVVFFVIAIVIFGIAVIAIGANLLDKVEAPKNEIGNNNTSGNGTSNNNTTPEEPVEQSNIEIRFSSVTDGVKLNVTSNLEIDTIEYWWDEEVPTPVEATGTEHEVVIPTKQGTHTLKVKVTDINEYEKTKEQLVIGDVEPEVTIGTDGISNYVVKAKDDEQLTKIVIKVNDQVEEIEINDKTFEKAVPIPTGDSIIDVTVYNLNGLSINKKAKITNFQR